VDQTPLVAEVRFTFGAGFWIRSLARLIDIIFVGFLLGLVAGVLGGIILAILEATGIVAPGWQYRGQGFSATGFGLSLLGGILYHSASEGIHGASVGKLVCRLRVVSADGRPCDMKQALIRSLAYLWDAIFFGLVAYNCMQRSALKQRYGDVWAKTVVISSSYVPEESQRSIGRFFLGNCLGAACWIFLLVLGLILEAK
jgi:uncharacterized RDD family membrane protein YckC